ncbi:MAG TPA: Crp/Fnr family transcriptional regulator [Longimicrobiaceae bacterium]
MSHAGQQRASNGTRITTTGGEGRNRLLRALPPAELELLAPHLEQVEVEVLQPIADMNDVVQHVWFPDNAIISLLHRGIDGTPIEIGTVGSEGMAGLTVAFGVDWTPALILGEVPGSCRRMDAARFRELLPTLPTLQALLGRYAVYLLGQVGQSLACNSLHSLEQRCARWILMTHDRVEGDEFQLTQEVLAQMLAVHRPAVSVAAGALKRAGFIDYSRGRLVMKDRAGLEQAACECYGIVSRQRDRLLGE